MFVADPQLVMKPVERNQLNTVFHYHDFLSAEDCQSIINFGCAQQLSQAGVLADARNNANTVTDVRQTKLANIELSAETKPLFLRIKELVAICNEQYQFQLSGMFEHLQFLRYEEDDQYGWHKDVGPGLLSMRKISVVVHLNAPGEFDGGELQTMIDGNPSGVEWRQGSATIMPSYEMHRVTPVTRGVRHSLVCWFSGQPFM